MHWLSIPTEDGGGRWINLAQVTEVRYRAAGNGLPDHLVVHFSGSADDLIRVTDLHSMAAIRNRLELLASQALAECPRCDGLGVVVGSDNRSDECGQCHGAGEIGGAR